MDERQKDIRNQRTNVPTILSCFLSSTLLHLRTSASIRISAHHMWYYVTPLASNMHKWAILTTIYIIHLIQMHSTRARTHYHSPWDYKGNKTVTGCVLYSVRVLSHEMRMFLGDSITEHKRMENQPIGEPRNATLLNNTHDMTNGEKEEPHHRTQGSTQVRIKTKRSLHSNAIMSDNG